MIFNAFPFREDGTTEEPTASIKDLEFKVHKNTFEGADHFILIFIQETLLSYSITKNQISFSKKDTCPDECYIRKLGSLWG